MDKVLVSPSSFGQCGLEPLNLLSQCGFDVIVNPYGRKMTEDEIIELAKGCIGIVAGVETLSARVLDALVGLKCISRVGIGMDNIDLDCAKKKGIVVVNTPDGPTRSVAELTLAMTLSLLRKIPQADAAMKSRKWTKQIGSLLFQKKIGIIGLGRIGRLVAEMFRALGNTVIGHDVCPDSNWARSHGVQLASFEQVIEQSLILSLHIPGNTDKTAIIGKDELARMTHGAFLVNIARGGVVDEEALFQALKTKRLAGAAIDVFFKEPYDGPLCDLENVILTPHLGSYAMEGKLQMEIDAVQNLLNALEETRK